MYTLAGYECYHTLPPSSTQLGASLGALIADRTLRYAWQLADPAGPSERNGTEPGAEVADLYASSIRYPSCVTFFNLFWFESAAICGAIISQFWHYQDQLFHTAFILYHLILHSDHGPHTRQGTPIRPFLTTSTSLTMAGPQLTSDQLSSIVSDVSQ
jgi:hypothetical protein